MEEKERYSLEEFDDIDWELAIVDNELGKSLTFEEIKNLLNKQDKRIKELEEEVMVGEFWHSAYKGKELDNDLLLKENQQLKERIGKQFDKIQTLTKTCDVEKEFGDKMALENRELKQSQKQLTINELVKLRRHFFDLFLYPTFDVLSSIIDKQIEKLKGE